MILMEIEIINPKRRVVEDLKIRNQGNGKTIAGEYYGSKFNYDDTFKMFNDYKKAFLHLEGQNESAITISAPSTIASVNAFYGAIDANKIANMTGPGFLYTYTDKYTREINSRTVFILDMFLNDDFINRLHNAGVKNVIITSATDYMNPIVHFIGKKKGLIDDKDFLDEYIKIGHKLPMDMNFIRLSEFAKIGPKITEDVEFPYEENKIAAYFLTGATTSNLPKDVQLYADGFTKMSQTYDKMWFDFGRGDRNAIFIPLYYATGAIHGIHAGLFSGATNIYLPKYDKYTYGNDLAKSKAKIDLVAPSHLSTLENSTLKNNSLKNKYTFIGGEAIMPAQMKKYRETGRRLGIKNVFNGYGMTETGSMLAMSSSTPTSDDDVTVYPIPGVKFRVVNPDTGEILPDNKRGVLEADAPCATAGYLDEEKNKKLFTKDGWIHTGDIAVKYSNGGYRIFGRDTDCFVNNGVKYYMFDIEEKVLEHPGVCEAEVIKFEVNGEEYPAIVIVINKGWEDKLDVILKDLSELDIPGIQYLVGTKFVDNFKTNPVTSKRDYLTLYEEKNGYYKFNKNNNIIYQFDITTDGMSSIIPVKSYDLTISSAETEKKLVLKK